MSLLTREGQPGYIRTISGKFVNLVNPDMNDLVMFDIAHSLGTMVRYNGHIPVPYTVLEHSMIMSYVAPDKYKLEALLHDAGEAYCGDIIYPLKQLFPEIEEFENKVTAKIFEKFVPSWKQFVLNDQYVKSPAVSELDTMIGRHECHMFGRHGGIFFERIEKARAELAHDYPTFNQSNVAKKKIISFMDRYNELNLLELSKSK